MNTNDLIDEILRQVKQPIWENWYIKEKIGSGAFSAVYRVEAKRAPNRTSVAAMKIEPITAEGKPFINEERKRAYLNNKKHSVENEAEIMYNLRKCPYVVMYEEEDYKELYIDGEFEGYYYLIRMEYLTGISSLIHARKLDLSEKNIIKLASDIGKGIMAAHKLGIIHRDIKIDNFFVDELGTYKVGDFNISKKTGVAKTFAGTSGYLAPEIYRAKSNADNVYTNQADIYSFGICLYQLLNDLLFPFEDELDIEDAIDKRMKGVQLPPPKNASEKFAEIILRACEFETEDRYSTIGDMLDDIESLTDNRKSSTAQKERKSPRKEKIKETAEQADNIPTSGTINSVPDLKTNGELVQFGSYYVAVSNTKMPLLWKILDIKDDNALLTTFMGVDVKSFHDTPQAVSWKDSSIRRWLNNEFYNEVFSGSEKNMILKSYLTNSENYVYKTPGGDATTDNVFLLSFNEVENYFPTDEDRKIKPTAYARSKGVFSSEDGYAWWWLRSSGVNEKYAADVDYGGDIDAYGSDKYNSMNCVRPAVWISLSSLGNDTVQTFRKSFLQSRSNSFKKASDSSSKNKSGSGKREQSTPFRVVELGSFLYENKFQSKPIEWYVLDTDSRYALLVSVKGLECLEYNVERMNVTWERSQLRRWLNNDFISIAFSDKERKFIRSTSLPASDNPVYGTSNGKTTTDKIFLLSAEEANKYFKSNSERMLMPTPYTASRGLFVAANGCSWWWLRSSGKSGMYAADVDYGGDIDLYGNIVSSSANAVRPAMWVDRSLIDV